jgi:hypothetical protein
MLLTVEILGALQTLQTSEDAGDSAPDVTEPEAVIYRILDVQGLARCDVGQRYALTEGARDLLRVLQEMRGAGLLPDMDQAHAGWRFLGSETLASLAAVERAGGRVGPAAQEALRARGFVDPNEGKARAPQLNRYGTAMLDWARRYRPRLEITGEVAMSMKRMPPAYAEPHTLGVPSTHRAQLEAMDLLAWSAPDGQDYTLTAAGYAVYETLHAGGYAVTDVVLDEATLSQLATLKDRGMAALNTDQAANVQALGYVDADGLLTPAGEAALRVRRLLAAEPTRHPASFAISREEGELLAVVHRLSAPEPNATHQVASTHVVTKAALHKALVDRLTERYREMVGRYGRELKEVPARKRQVEALLAELRERDRAFARPDDLDDLLIHLEAFDLLRTKARDHETVYQLTPPGLALVREQGREPRDITATAVKAMTITTTPGRFQAPASDWVRQARAEGLIGSRGGITNAGRMYALVAAQATRWPALTRSEVRTLLNLREVEAPERERQPGEVATEEERLKHDLDRLEARGLIDRLVDRHIVRTEAGDLLARAVSGALELARPVTPAIVRLLAAIRHVGTTLYVHEQKPRRPPEQWEEVKRLTGLGSDDFKETVHLARLGRYLGDAGLTEAGDKLLAVLDKDAPSAMLGELDDA